MKKLILVSIFSYTLISCGAVNRTFLGMTEKRVIQTVSVEQGCPIEDITITNRIKANGNATYSLNVCGKRMVYKQIGSVIMEASASEKMINDLNK